MGFLSNAISWVGENLFGIGQTAAQVGAQAKTNAVNKAIADANIQFQREANAQNIALTREQNALNRALTNSINSQNIAFQQNENVITRAREDNAVQRRAEDLQKAGLSKTLSAGSPASASPMTAPSAQGMHYDRATVQAINNQRKYESALMRLSIADNFANYKLKMSEANKNNAQAITLGEQGKMFKSSTELNVANTRIASIVGDKKATEIDTEISYQLQKIAESKNVVSLNNERILEISYNIAHTIAQTENLGFQSQMLIQQIVGQKLNNLTNSWNLSRNMMYGTPTNYSPGILGKFDRDVAGVFNTAIYGNDFYSNNLNEIMSSY